MKPVKSAQRVFEILEYFDALHPEATVSEIADRYGYPQSSASELLNYMVALGYLCRGSRGRSFRLTIRVSMLGSWVQPNLIRTGHLLGIVDDIAECTGRTVILSSNSGVDLYCLHVVPSGENLPVHQEVLPILSSADGKALLLTCGRELVRKYVHRLNASVERDEDRIRYDALSDELDVAAAQGYARSLDGGVLSIAMLIPNSGKEEQVAICVKTAEPSEEAQIVRMLRVVICRRLGLIRVANDLVETGSVSNTAMQSKSPRAISYAQN
ncbi:IclR family transcriptional regulator [Croceicoccus ponticola]|uniref:IclR family transcriptional regulator n=1 Tax=Croceicoccus ponticola TaxID=2217664 RepID=UPI0013E30575|nr:helix-turn-helix domain-containing protein [Croceicoccus ponticola]